MLISVLLAGAQLSTIVSILSISWGAIGAVFLGPFLWGLFTNWANKVGAIASAVLGLGTCIVLYAVGRSSPEAGTIGMMVSIVAAPLFSALSRPFLAPSTPAHQER